jgi:CHASE3 domain sensor protein
MEAENLWRCFLETGAPEYYLLYKAAKAEGTHVFENPGACAAGGSV